MNLIKGARRSTWRWHLFALCNLRSICFRRGGVLRSPLALLRRPLHFRHWRRVVSSSAKYLYLPMVFWLDSQFRYFSSSRDWIRDFLSFWAAAVNGENRKYSQHECNGAAVQQMHGFYDVWKQNAWNGASYRCKYLRFFIYLHCRYCCYG